jgi:hypothetical protein
LRDFGLHLYVHLRIGIGEHVEVKQALLFGAEFLMNLRSRDVRAFHLIEKLNAAEYPISQ